MAPAKAYSDSLISWVGGKKQLRKQIAELIPEDIHGYIEPFGGAGWVLFYKEKWGLVEVYNDINGDLVNLFRIAKHHPEALEKEFELLVPSRELFYQVKENPGYTDIHRATRFLYLVHRSFGSMGKHFGTSKRSRIKSHNNIMEKIRIVSARLDSVLIENKPYDKLIVDYDHPENFFYCDPPYIHGYDYGLEFDHQKLRNNLANVKGRWLLSLDDCDEARELFKNYRIISTSRQKGIERRYGSMTYNEVLIMNY